MDDLIYRAEAIEKAKHDYDFFKGSSNLLDKVRSNELLNVIFWLGNLPSAQPKRIKAKWRHYEGMYTCENCNATLDDESPFCPMCGAEMREENQFCIGCKYFNKGYCMKHKIYCDDFDFCGEGEKR